MFSEADLKSLEFDVIRRLLERQTATPYGADHARALHIEANVDNARARAGATAAARRLIEQGMVSPLTGTPDVRAALRQARTEGTALTGVAFHHLMVFLTAASKLGEFATREPAIVPPGAALSVSTALTGRMTRAVTPGGQIRPEASPELTAAHGAWAAQREVVGATLGRLLETLVKEPEADRKARVSWSGGRGTLTLPRAIADTLKGVRRGTGAKGADLLIEPLVVVGENNRLEALQGEWDAAQAVFRRRLTDDVRAELAAFEYLVAVVTWADVALASARLALQFNAVAPELSSEPCIALDRAYHPALLLQCAMREGPAPVPLTLDITGDNRLVIITGPNTGGKTVVLKTVGLLVAMAGCGLQVPAEGSCRIGWFDRLVVGIGDAQSLQNHLSTFAGHVQTLNRLLGEAHRDTLVLIDELGTGTDPDEGAALAMAVLDELATRGVTGLITTHLPPLKAYRREGVVPAAMQFDEYRLEPTYRLVAGAVGASHGLTIAERAGLPAPLMQQARVYLERLTRPVPGDSDR